jgi:hypothetical protein
VALGASVGAAGWGRRSHTPKITPHHSDQVAPALTLNFAKRALSLTRDATLRDNPTFCSTSVGSFCACLIQGPGAGVETVKAAVGRKGN